jgi:hypothetical protein
MEQSGLSFFVATSIGTQYILDEPLDCYEEIPFHLNFFYRLFLALGNPSGLFTNSKSKC